MFICCAACGRAPGGQPIRAEASGTGAGRTVTQETPIRRRSKDKDPTKPSIGLGLATTTSATAFADALAAAEPDVLPPTPLSVHEADAASGAPVSPKTDGKKEKDDENPTKVLKRKNRRRSTEDEKTKRLGGLKRRGSIMAMEDYLNKDKSAAEVSAALSSQLPSAPGRSSVGASVTAENASIGMTVVRGPKWKRGDEDGGPGSCGQIFAVDGEKRTLMVRWEASRAVHDNYQLDGELALFDAGGGTASTTPVGGTASITPVSSSATSSVTSGTPLNAFMGGRRRRDSQAFFSDMLQTIIIYDWDDTLFPTTYVRDDMDFHWRTPLMEQKGIPRSELITAKAKLAACQKNVLALLRDSMQLGKVVILTLAKDPWVVESCKNFFPEVGELIRSAKIPVVYAQDGVQVDYNKLSMSSDADVERHWSGVKGKAIARTIDSFYSQYQGQSWKNVISIGDSDFERLGTMQATAEYLSKLSTATPATRSDSKTSRSGSKTPTNAMKALNKYALGGLFGKTRSDKPTLEAEVGGHVIKVRTKTFKMVDQPECDEVTTQVAMITKWIALMVKLDEGFDVNLNDLGNPAVLAKIELTLRGRRGSSP